MAAPAHTVEQKLTHTDYVVTLIPPWPAPRKWMAEIDEALLGFRRDLHHKFLLGGTAGYAYISAHGHVGPLAILPDADMKGGRNNGFALRIGERAEPSVDVRSRTGGDRHASCVGARVPHRSAPRADGVPAVL